MLPRLFLVLLLLNLGLLLWGWTGDRPLDRPPPPLAQAPGEIRLLSEAPAPAPPGSPAPPTRASGP